MAALVHQLYATGRVLLAEKRTRAGRKREVMLRLLDWIDKNYVERISISQLAEIAEAEEKYLCRFFKEYTGNSPIDYINRLRVERACLRMAKGEASVTEAALDSGFNDVSYFCKTFKKYKGVTPREYCRMLGGSNETERVRI